MRIVLAPDSFKESMTAREAAEAMAAGVHDVLPDAECIQVPMSDGGEGFVQAVAATWGADLVPVASVDALGRPIVAEYALDGARAVIDVASCAGIELIAPAQRDVAASDTAGLGMVIRDALTRGARTLLIGIGGSATNEAGIGMLHALGLRLFDEGETELPPNLTGLERVARVDTSAMDALMEGVEVKVACDVTNPLCGPSGATATFGPQKGVRAEQVEAFDAVLHHFAQVSGYEEEALLPGSGAAGGLGFALRAFMGATLVPGLALVAEAVGLADTLRGAQLVLTGEGSVDAQTVGGKTPAGVAALAASVGASVILFAGRVGPGAEALCEAGVDGIVQITPPGQPLAEALRRGRENLRAAVADTVRTVLRAQGGAVSLPAPLGPSTGR